MLEKINYKYTKFKFLWTKRINLDFSYIYFIEIKY